MKWNVLVFFSVLSITLSALWIPSSHGADRRGASADGHGREPASAKVLRLPQSALPPTDPAWVSDPSALAVPAKPSVTSSNPVRFEVSQDHSPILAR